MSDALVDRLRGAPTTLLSDALRGSGRDPARFVITGLTPLVAAPGPVIGPAITTRYEPSGEPVTPEDVRRFVFDPIDAGRPGEVWVIGSGSDLILSMMGDILALRCRQRGLAAAVIDGGCRDLAALDAIGFPVFARGPCPYGPFGRLRPVDANVPVVCRGVEVRPGDLVAADRDGVIVLPGDAAADVARLWPERAAREARARAQVAEGVSLSVAYPLTLSRPPG